jgi:alkanesulfonate monooxygenase SsuD/methylene tetrahydromethanopterin reductase-like flavin-dependent oxidoreductase (luciferase family)
MLRLAAQHADLWNTWFSQTNNDLGQLRTLLGQVDSACARSARDPASLRRTAAVKMQIGPHAPSAMSAPALSGAPDELAGHLRAYAQAGISHVQLWIEPNTVAGYKAFAPVLDALDRG